MMNIEESFVKVKKVSTNSYKGSILKVKCFLKYV